MANKIFVFEIQKMRSAKIRGVIPVIKTEKLQVPADTLNQAMFRLGANFRDYNTFSSIEAATEAATSLSWPVDAIVVSYQGEVL